MKDLIIKCYKDFIGRSKIKSVQLCKVLKHIVRIIVRLKAIKYKMDVACYLFFMPSSLAIKPSYQTY